LGNDTLGLCQSRKIDAPDQRPRKSQGGKENDVWKRSFQGAEWGFIRPTLYSPLEAGRGWRGKKKRGAKLKKWHMG